MSPLGNRILRLLPSGITCGSFQVNPPSADHNTSGAGGGVVVGRWRVDLERSAGYSGWQQSQYPIAQWRHDARALPHIRTAKGRGTEGPVLRDPEGQA